MKILNIINIGVINGKKQNVINLKCIIKVFVIGVTIMFGNIVN